MTYCVAIAVDAGLVFCSDSRTNAGIDRVSTYSKMFRFGVDGQRQFVILSSGNLGTTQATISRVKRDIKERAMQSLLTVESISEAADYLGGISRTVQEKHDAHGTGFEASFVIGGQIAGKKHRIMMVYPEGNHITSSHDTPYLQIGEHKYGKPILDRVVRPDTRIHEAKKAVLLSMDSTLRSNLSVGMPLDLCVIGIDTQQITEQRRIEPEDEVFQAMSHAWSQALRDAFQGIEI